MGFMAYGDLLEFKSIVLVFFNKSRLFLWRFMDRPRVI